MDESPSKRTRTNFKWDVNLRSRRFADILKTDTFVDKTLLIREFLTSERSCLVTSPRRFGKSVNVDMLKSFLTIEVDEKGHRKTTAKANEPVRDTETYRMFADHIPKLPERYLNISKDQTIMDNYLGKYPVIYVNFKSAAVHSFEKAISECKHVIRECYIDHQYLCQSDKLYDYEKDACEKWCTDDDYSSKSCDEVKIVRGLKNLSIYLTKHFERKCFLIVDEYDSICSSAMFKVEEPILELIVEFFLCCLDFVCKDNDNNVEGSFFTGISRMCTTGLGRLGNVLPFPFLRNDRFVNFYGLTSEELDDLRKRLPISEEKYKEASKYYNGYVYKGHKIVCTWSFMCFISKKKLGPFWKSSGVCTALKNTTFKSSVVKSWVMKLLSSSGSTQEIGLYDSIQVSQLVELRKMSENPDIELSDASLLFNFLQEQGFLNFRDFNEDLGKASVEIPNEEIRKEFKERLLSYYRSSIKGLDFTLVKYCAALWDSVDFIDEGTTKRTFEEISRVLNKIFAAVSLEKKNEACFHHVFFVILLHSKFKCSSEIPCVPLLNQRSVDILLVHENHVIVLELKYNESALKALNQIIDTNRNYCDIFEINHTYVEDVKSYILLGTNMNEDKHITMVALLNNKDINNKIIIHQ